MRDAMTFCSLFPLSLSLFIQAETEAIIKVADPNSKYTSAQTFDELGLSRNSCKVSTQR